jgi:hypothetical protein
LTQHGIAAEFVERCFVGNSMARLGFVVSCIDLSLVLSIVQSDAVLALQCRHEALPDAISWAELETVFRFLEDGRRSYPVGVVST